MTGHHSIWNILIEQLSDTMKPVIVKRKIGYKIYTCGITNTGAKIDATKQLQQAPDIKIPGYEQNKMMKNNWTFKTFLCV